MRRIQIFKKLFFKLSDFEHVRSHVLQCYESSALQRNGTNDNLVPVTFPVNDVFPHRQKNLKPLVASLEFWWVWMALSDLYMPKNRDGYY
jgi:hypothetical protein